MTFFEAVALQPVWVQIWLNILLFCVLFVPLSWLIWPQSRVAAVITLAAVAASAVSIMWLYEQIGYTRLLGLPHILFWGPLLVYLIGQLRRGVLPVWPARLIKVTCVAMGISLAFDCVDTLRWIAGDRAPMTAGASVVQPD